MKILVINGSPKGQYSATLQTSLYLELLHPEHSFAYIDAGAKIKQYEKDFRKPAEAILNADLIIFSYPVYTFLVPSQLHRFIELMKLSGLNLKSKFVTQITTSKHFYDVTAHAFIRENCLDMGMKYLDGLSADMDDLTCEKGRQEARSFFNYIIWNIENDLYMPAVHTALAKKDRPFATVPEYDGEKSGDVVIVADLAPDDDRLRKMLLRFRAVCKKKTRVVNLREFAFKGGCISCFNCAMDGECIYKDGFSQLLRDRIQQGDAIVIAFSIKDHSMGSLFKTYDDRQFCNGHRTVTMGKPFGYIISGELSREENLRTVIQARAQVGGNFLAGTATDEFNPDRELDDLADRLCYAIDNKYTQPSNFYGVGGMKIFRDLIWLMQGMMKADHRFYKAHGQYDFPQKKFGTMLAMYLVGALISNKKLKAKLGNKMNEGMVRPYKKVLEKARLEMQK